MGKKILVIDDEPDVRTFITTLLEQNGYDTVTANDGVVAYDIAKREKPDLITLDLAMPDKTGTGFYRNLMKDKELQDIPVIVVSGLAGRHLAVKDPVAVFDKPIDAEEFLAVVKQTLG